MLRRFGRASISFFNTAASGEIFDTKMAQPLSIVSAASCCIIEVGDRKMDPSEKSDMPSTSIRRKSPTAMQVRVSLSPSTSSDGPKLPHHQSPNNRKNPQKPSSAAKVLSETNTSELPSSYLGPAQPAAPVVPLRTGVPELLPSHQELNAVGDVRHSQLQAYKRVLLDQLFGSSGPCHTSRQSLTAFSSVPSSFAKAFGGSGVPDGSMRSASVRGWPCTKEVTAPRSPSAEASVANGFNKGSELPLSPPAIVTEIPYKELPGRDDRKRKRGSEPAVETTDFVVRSILDEGAVRSRLMMSHMESSTMTTPRASTEVRPTSTTAEEDHRVATVSYILSQQDLLRRERERFLSALTLHPSNSSVYDTGAYRSQLGPIDHAAPAISPFVLPPILYGISNARLAQHLSLTSPALAHLNTRSFSSPSHIAMLNSDHLLALAQLEQMSRRDTRIFGEGILSREPNQTQDFSGPSEMSNSLLNPALRESLMPDAQYQDMNQNVDHAVHGRCFPLHSDQDQHNISPYQYFIRRQIEVFEATAKEAGTNAQGRNRPILPGQVGIRCRHCGRLESNQRGTGAVYFPNRLDGVYQTGEFVIIRWPSIALCLGLSAPERCSH